MDTIQHAECHSDRARACARLVPMPYADRLAAHMFLGDMVVFGVKALVRRIRDARWPDPLPHGNAGTCAH